MNDDELRLSGLLLGCDGGGFSVGVVGVARLTRW